MFRACVLTLGDRSPSRGRSRACRRPLHTGNTSGKSTRPARLRHCAAITLVRTISGVRMLGCAIRFRCSLEAGMMNPRRLSTVPAPLLRSVILATGVVGLLAAFGPAGNQNTGAAPATTSALPLSPPNRSSPGHRSQARCSMTISVKPMWRWPSYRLRERSSTHQSLRTSRSRWSKRPRPFRRTCRQPDRRLCKSQW